MNCAVCSKELFTDNPLTYFCKLCYSTYKDDIINKAEWVRYCVTWEGRQRRQGKRDLGKLVYLGSDYDISTDGRLIRIEFEIA